MQNNMGTKYEFPFANEALMGTVNADLSSDKGRMCGSQLVDDLNYLLARLTPTCHKVHQDWARRSISKYLHKFSQISWGDRHCLVG
jgi:hypothetical protein